MLNESLLWRRAVSPTGRLVKEETFLGAILKFTLIAAAGMLLAIALLYFV
jgi:hypothetical protein